MANFFMRGAAAGVSATGTAQSAAKYRKTATALRFGNSNMTFQSKVDAASAPGEIRRSFQPDAILQEAKIHIQGIGLVVRAEATIKFFGASSIGAATKLLGNTFTITMPGISKSFQCYDLAFSNTKPSGWEVTVKGMSQNDNRSFEFIDISAGSLPSVDTLGTALPDVLPEPPETGTDPATASVEASNIVQGLLNGTIDQLIRKGDTLADNIENMCLSLFNFGAGANFRDFFSVETMAVGLGSKLYTQKNPELLKSGGIACWRGYGLEAMQNSDNTLLRSGLCGWVTLKVLCDLISTYCTPGSATIAFTDNYSKVQLPTIADRWIGASPFTDIMFHNGTSFVIDADDIVTQPEAFPFTSAFPGNMPGTSSPQSPTGVPFPNIGPFAPKDIILTYSEFDTPGNRGENIWLSTTLIRRLQNELQKPNPSVSENRPLAERAIGSFPLGRFMDKIFDAIRMGTGGVIDFTLDKDGSLGLPGWPSAGLMVDQFFVVSRKPGSPVVSATPISLNTSNDRGYGIRDAKVSGNVSNDLAARLFGKTAEVSGVSKVFSTPPAPTAPTWDLMTVGRAIGNAGGINTETSQQILDGNNKLALAHIQSIATMDPSPLPTELTVTVDGSASVVPFAAVNVSPAIGLAGGTRVVWAITDVTHRATGTDFVTEFKAISRMVI